MDLFIQQIVQLLLGWKGGRLGVRRQSSLWEAQRLSETPGGAGWGERRSGGPPQTMQFVVFSPNTHVQVLLWDWDRSSSDDFLGEGQFQTTGAPPSPPSRAAALCVAIHPVPAGGQFWGSAGLTCNTPHFGMPAFHPVD